MQIDPEPVECGWRLPSRFAYNSAEMKVDLKKFGIRRPAEGPPRILFTKADTKPGKTLLIRIGIVVGLLLLLIAVLWLDREGLRDAVDGRISFSDVVYFTMVTLTTVGYGDIVPVTDRARLIDALLVTPIRIFVWFIFLGTAYQFVYQKLLEDYRMARLKRTLEDHVVICGYGDMGRVAAKELVTKGHPTDQIVVIDLSGGLVQEAAEAGFVALHGDATKEALMRRAGIELARAAIVCPGRDDTNVLIVLTIRQLNPTLKIISSVKDDENIKLIRQGGADLIISPSTVGGFMLADAVDRAHTVDYLHDLMTADGRVDLEERTPAPEEIGKSPRSISDCVVVRVQRGSEKFGFWQLDDLILQASDILIMIVRTKKKPEAS